MQRRSFLTSLTIAGSLTAIAGCVDVLADENESDGYSTDVQSPEDTLLNHSISIVDGGYADPETPLTLEVELTNSTDQPVGYRDTRDANFHFGRDEDDRYYLLPMKYNDDEYREFDDNHWRITTPDLMISLELRTGILVPGETATKKRVLALQYDENPPESRPEKLRFSTSYEAAKMPEHSESDPAMLGPESSEAESYSWSFSLKQE